MKKNIIIILSVIAVIFSIVLGINYYNYSKYNEELNYEKDKLEEIKNKVNEINNNFDSSTSNYEKLKNDNQEKMEEYEKWLKRNNEVKELLS